MNYQMETPYAGNTNNTQQNNIHDRIVRSASRNQPNVSCAKFPSTCQPTQFDVLCGREKESRSHSGNRKFRELIAHNLKRYIKAESRNERSIIVQSIVNEIRNDALSVGGAGFIRKCANADENGKGRWIEIGDQQARDKCAHALRDLQKLMKRRKDRPQQDGFVHPDVIYGNANTTSNNSCSGQAIANSHGLPTSDGGSSPKDCTSRKYAEKFTSLLLSQQQYFLQSLIEESAASKSSR